MRRHWWVSFALLAWIATVPLSAQETILGFFEGQPGSVNAGTGALTLKGWALADSGVSQVIIQVDGRDVGQALYGKRRPGVERKFPGFPDSARPGFTFRLNSPRYRNGLHSVSAKVITHDGNVEVLRKTRQIQFNNNTTILVPFGDITTPQRNAEVFGTCNPFDPRRRLVPVEGWALDLGVETNDAGIGWVELMVDNQPFFNTRTGCRFILEAGGLTNCYGLPRFGIERLYPFAKDAPNAGFRFVLDIGAMISTLGYTEGQHLLTIRAGDTSNQVADIDEIGVVFRCIEGIPNEGAFGTIELPRQAAILSGDMRVQGWALDAEGVDKVRILIDGELVGEADYGAEDGIYDTRPGVFSRYLGFPDVAAPVFRLSNVDTTQLSDGGHQLQVVVIDDEGDSTLIGEVTFSVNNRDD